jgi:hypothetical protein
MDYFGRMKLAEEREILGRTCPEPLRLPQILHYLARARSSDDVAGNGRITTRLPGYLQNQFEYVRMHERTLVLKLEGSLEYETWKYRPYRYRNNDTSGCATKGKIYENAKANLFVCVT